MRKHASYVAKFSHGLNHVQPIRCRKAPRRDLLSFHAALASSAFLRLLLRFLRACKFLDADDPQRKQTSTGATGVFVGMSISVPRPCRPSSYRMFIHLSSRALRFCRYRLAASTIFCAASNSAIARYLAIFKVLYAYSTTEVSSPILLWSL